MMLPAGIEIRSVLGADAISFSELGTLARCEQAWVYGYTGVRERSQPSKAQALGTEIHRLWGAFWRDGVLLDSENEVAARVMDRYARHYGQDGTLTCIGIEVPAAARLPWGPYFFGFIDGLFDVEGLDVPDGLYVGEAKSADKLASATHLVQSPQTPLYVWTLRQMGLPVVGAFIDILRTSNAAPKVETKAQAYKRLRSAGVSVAEATERSATERLELGEAPLEESFDRRWLLGPELLDIPRAIAQARRASGVRRQLLDGEPPLRAVGPSCSWCFAQATCFGLEVELADEAEDLQPF